jgi:hypothetical protein
VGWPFRHYPLLADSNAFRGQAQSIAEPRRLYIRHGECRGGCDGLVARGRGTARVSPFHSEQPQTYKGATDRTVSQERAASRRYFSSPPSCKPEGSTPHPVNCLYERCPALCGRFLNSKWNRCLCLKTIGTGFAPGVRSRSAAQPYAACSATIGAPSLFTARNAITIGSTAHPFHATESCRARSPRNKQFSSTTCAQAIVNGDASGRLVHSVKGALTCSPHRTAQDVRLLRFLRRS